MNEFKELQNVMKLRSDEERQFVAWIKEAKEKGLVTAWDYEPGSWELVPKTPYTRHVVMKTKIKKTEQHLFHSMSYTPDVVITLSAEGMVMLDSVLCMAIYSAKPYNQVYGDIKGTYNPHQKDTRYFSAMQKLMYVTHSIWPDKIIPKLLFKSTWIPEKYRWMKNRKKPTLTKAGKECKTIDEFIKEQKGDELYKKKLQYCKKLIK